MRMAHQVDLLRQTVKTTFKFKILRDKFGINPVLLVQKLIQRWRAEGKMPFFIYFKVYTKIWMQIGIKGGFIYFNLFHY